MVTVSFELNPEQQREVKKFCEIAKIKEEDFYRLSIHEKLERIKISAFS